MGLQYRSRSSSPWQGATEHSSTRGTSFVPVGTFQAEGQQSPRASNLEQRELNRRQEVANLVGAVKRASDVLPKRRHVLATKWTGANSATDLIPVPGALKGFCFLDFCVANCY
jgi:hypothetical protein